MRPVLRWSLVSSVVLFLASCSGLDDVDPTQVGAAICGDGVVNGNETCDDGNRASGDGCSSKCVLEVGLICNDAGVCVSPNDPSGPTVPGGYCGDGTFNIGESCDDGNNENGDGCSASCSVETGYVCPGGGNCHEPVCGDRMIEGSETCDDGNSMAGDGCANTCTVEPGWECRGSFCFAKACGDGIVAGAEECEDDNVTPTSGDGCTAQCKLEPGWGCATAGQACTRAVCGNGVKEGLEQCDDGNANWGDTCTPDCKREPDCSRITGQCADVCGDGVILPNSTEECDDGNTRANDGCSPNCKVEAGFSCTVVQNAPPDTLQIPVVYRDFKAYNYASNAHPHPDFNDRNGAETGMCGALYAPLDADGKPALFKNGRAEATDGGTVIAGRGTSTTAYSRAKFAQWYRDDPTVNRTVRSELTLTRGALLTYTPDSGEDPDPADAYVFRNKAFFPLDDKGWNTPLLPALEFENRQNDGSGNPHNFGFTSETRYWFQYKGTEKLTFFGDDDVFVFINNRLAVDIGGVHGPQQKNVTLSAHAGTNQLNLTQGGIYEAVVFQAERHVTGSQYKLTLAGFETRTSTCTPEFVCGDGVVQPPQEQCDAGTANNTGGYGKCQANCTLGPRCGDGVVQQGESCDDGNNVDGDMCPGNCIITIN